MKNKNSTMHIQKVFIYIFLMFIVAICLIPFVMMIVNSTRSASDIVAGFTLIPGDQFWPNFNALASYVDIWQGMINSAMISTGVIILTAYFSALTAFGFEFYDFKGKKFLFGLVLLMMMVPVQLGLLGFYDLNYRLGLLDSYIPLILPSVANIGAMFFIRQYMASTIHRALLEAARIDGSSEIAIFHKIVFPLSTPAIATMSIMAFIGSWNNYMTPLILIQSVEKKTLPVLIAALRGARVVQQNYGAIYSAITVSVLPILIIFVVFAKFIISGISAGSVKG